MSTEIKYLKDYQPTAYTAKTLDMLFDIHDDQTLVTTKTEFIRQDGNATSLRLNGRNLELLELHINDAPHSDYSVGEAAHDHELVLNNLPADGFTLTTKVKLHPEHNTALEGLYQSSGIFTTQCEAEGFRRITYALDRPDVMSTYHVRIEADKKYPCLLSNGNLLASGDLENGRHFAEWHDPHVKPSYLFALVAGDLAHIEKTIKTRSGRDVLLQLYTEKAFIHQADWGMEALIKSIRWDEETFDLEYDLDRFMIVAIGDFNMGAMENKGLNIFNTSCVLADTETQTDDDFLRVENIIGHEYFHNWTGNRITCRDWFQLALKEGLTVFRDSIFSADMTTKGIKRLEEVNTVRNLQFVEDAGPTAHPVRPDKFIEISNFYTLTVYEKGGEVIRMMWNLLGEENFKKGMKLYFKRHDGHAVTVEDFAQAMTDASERGKEVNLMGQFFRWYTQSGTPVVTVTSEFDANTKQYKLHFSQNTPASHDQAEKQPVVIPIAMKLFNQNGQAIDDERVFILDTESDTFVIDGQDTAPVASLFRNFSAPVKVEFEQSDADLHTLVKYDDDLFVRFDAMQLLYKRFVKATLDGHSPSIDELVDTARSVLKSNTDAAEKVEILSIPALSVFYDVVSPVDVSAVDNAVKHLSTALASALKTDLLTIVNTAPTHDSKDMAFEAIAERRLHGFALNFLAKTNDSDIAELAYQSYQNASVMTNRMDALNALNNFDGELRDKALADFYETFKHDPQVVDKWLSLNARADFDKTIARIDELLEHEAFSLKTPNKVRSLIGGLAMGNPVQFHRIDGKGYELFTKVIKAVDKLNGEISARMVFPLLQWKQYDEARQAMMKSALESLKSDDMTKNLYEQVTKALA